SEKVHPALRVFILIAEDIDGLQAPAIANGKISIGLCPITPFPNIRQHDTDESSDIIRIVIQVFLSMNLPMSFRPLRHTNSHFTCRGLHTAPYPFRAHLQPITQP